MLSDPVYDELNLFVGQFISCEAPNHPAQVVMPELVVAIEV